MNFCSHKSIFHKHSNSHRTYATRNRCYIRSLWLYAIEIYISAKFAIFISVHTNINDNSTLFDHIACNKLRLTDSRNKNISISCNFSKILCTAVCNCYSAVFMEQKHSHRLTNNITSADYNTILAGNFYIFRMNKLHNASRCARQELIIAYHNLTNIRCVESVNIFFRADCLNNSLFIKVLR